MSVKIRSEGEVQILELAGDFTAVSGQTPRPVDLKGHRLEDLGRILIDLLDRGHRSIVLDLSKVGFIDSAGLGELVACKKRTVERGGDIKLLHPGRQVHKLLVMTLLTQIFEVYQHEADVLASFGLP